MNIAVSGVVLLISAMNQQQELYVIDVIKHFTDKKRFA